MSSRHPLIGACVLIFAGCQLSHGSPASLLLDVPAAACPAGQTYSPFASTPAGFAPTPATVDFGEGRAYQLIPSDDKFAFRLDLCVDDADDSKIVLKQIVYKYFGGLPKIFPVGSDTEIKGLHAAIYEQDLAGLRVFTPTGVEQAFLIQGWRDTQGAFLTAGDMKKNNGRFVPRVPLLMASGLTYGDNMKDGPCGPGETTFHHVSFKAGTAAFETDMCQFQGGGMTMGYSFLKITVTDTNPALSPAEQKAFTFEKDSVEMKSMVGYGYRHHNQGDFLTVHLPHVRYAFTSDYVVVKASYAVQYQTAPEHRTELPCQYYFSCTFP